MNHRLIDGLCDGAQETMPPPAAQDSVNSKFQGSASDFAEKAPEWAAQTVAGAY